MRAQDQKGLATRHSRRAALPCRRAEVVPTEGACLSGRQHVKSYGRARPILKANLDQPRRIVSASPNKTHKARGRNHEPCLVVCPRFTGLR